MFGNQQNRQAANTAGSESFTSNAEKREYIPVNGYIPPNK